MIWPEQRGGIWNMARLYLLAWMNVHFGLFLLTKNASFVHGQPYPLSSLARFNTCSWFATLQVSADCSPMVHPGMTGQGEPS